MVLAWLIFLKDSEFFSLTLFSKRINELFLGGKQIFRLEILLAVIFEPYRVLLVLVDAGEVHAADASAEECALDGAAYGLVVVHHPDLVAGDPLKYLFHNYNVASNSFFVLYNVSSGRRTSSSPTRYLISY